MVVYASTPESKCMGDSCLISKECEIELSPYILQFHANSLLRHSWFGALDVIVISF